MDTRLKNNRKKRWIMIIVMIMICSIGGMCFYPMINQVCGGKQEQTVETKYRSDVIQEWSFRQIYQGCYLRYAALHEEYDWMKLYVDVPKNGKEVSEKEHTNEREEGMTDDLEEDTSLDSILRDRQREYMDQDRMNVDRGIQYIVFDSDTMESRTNGNSNLMAMYNKAKLGTLSDKEWEAYTDIFQLQFDQNGYLSCEVIKTMLADSEWVTSEFMEIHEREALSNLAWSDDVISAYVGNHTLSNPRNMQVLVFIKNGSSFSLAAVDEYMDSTRKQYGDYVLILFGAIALILLVFTIFITSRRFAVEGNVPRLWPRYYPGVFSIILLVPMLGELFWELVDMIRYTEKIHDFSSLEALLSGVEVGDTVVILLQVWGVTAAYLFLQFALLYEVVSIFRMGWKKYLTENLWLYLIGRWIVKKVRLCKEEMEHLSLEDQKCKTVKKVLLINYLILALISCCWFGGIFLLIPYSIVVYYLIKKYLVKVERDYGKLMYGMHQMTEGNLEVTIEEDLGVFEAMKEQVMLIQDGFQAAVAQEVRSERMKTELITNVSHDLKTPLTAITTYVELLKKTDITEEERASYIETLSDKALRLKVLIEDLFEVSKANSKTVQLNYMDVELVNLIKQVVTEHEEKYQELGLKVCYQIPEDKVMVSLDPEKSYRIFENLFGNIQKYAMQGSRVYVEVVRANQGEVKVTIKNISQDELNMDPSELTERFVRGDASRHTEGAGLGLAIAQSLTEAQNGHMHVEIDGDLFKAVLQWKELVADAASSEE